MFTNLILKNALRSNAAANLIYLNNPKVACSAIKLNLWGAFGTKMSPDTKDNIHEIEGSPFVDDISELDWIGSANVFTFVRNPFTRIISAYLNKIESKETEAWFFFAKRYGISTEAKISFDEFIKIIAGDSPDLLDPHWRPQTINVLFPLSKPNFVGHIEHLSEQLPTLLANYVPDAEIDIQPFNPHGTNANSEYKSFFVDLQTLQRVHNLYHSDFVNFNYSFDINAPTQPTETNKFLQHGHPGLDVLHRYSLATELDARLKVLDDLNPYQASSAVRWWELDERLQLVETDPKMARQLIRENMDTIISGTQPLKRTAARIAATHGFWSLCQRIANAEVSKEHF